MSGSGVLELLEEMIRIDSRNPFEITAAKGRFCAGSRDRKINGFLKEKLEQAGFQVEKQFAFADKKGNKHYNLIAEKGEGESSILFYGHSDTVSSKPWKSRSSALTPRKGEVEFQGSTREVIFGLGSNDMKAGLAVICSAFKDVDPRGYKIKVAFGVDEEFYSLGANVLAASPFMDDVKAVVVPEIGDGPNKFYGHGTVGIGRLGRCEFELKFFGTGGHGAISNDPTFVNAAEEVSKFCVEFGKFRKKYKDVFRFSKDPVTDKDTVNEIEGSMFVSKIDAGNESLSIPAGGRVVVDCTFTPLTDIRKLKRVLKSFVGTLYKKKILTPVEIEGVLKRVNVELKKRPTPYSEAYITAENHPFTVFVKDRVNETGEFRNYNMGYSVADENVFRRCRPDVPVIVCGPVGWNSHRADEWVEIYSVEKLLRLYAGIGKKFGEYLKAAI